MSPLVQSLFALAVALLLLYNGLLIDWRSMKEQCDRRLVRHFFALSALNYVLIPVATLALVAVGQATPSLNATLLLLSALPCAPFVPALARQFGEPGDWPIVVFFGCSALSLFMLPVLLLLLRTPYVGSDFLPPWHAIGASIGKYLLMVYVPFALGVAARALWARQVERCRDLIGRVASIYALLVVVLFIVLCRREILELPGRDYVLFLGFELICLLGALSLRASLGGAPATRILSSTVRNFALALAFAGVVLPHTTVALNIVVFSVIPIVVPLIVVATMRAARLGKARMLGC